jgi:glycosyltransferase involved in cell wall biosynthesis
MKAALAVPGCINTVTGGYIYDRRVLEGLRALGYDMTLAALPASFPDPTAADMTAAFAALDAVADHGPVIIDGLAFGALDPARVATLRAPVIALIHHPLAKESGLSDARQKHLFATEKANLACAQQVIVPSPHTAEILATDYAVPRAKITIARPGTDRSTGTHAPSSPPLILSVGIQLPRKGHDVLINALAQIKDLSWQAKIVGAPLDVQYAASLVAGCRAHGLTDRVTLAGQISNADLADLYNAAHVFALATRFEGYGIVFDEALVHGLPIISCIAGAVPDTVPKDARLLVPPDAPEDFAAALRNVLTDDTLHQRLARAAQTAGATLPGWTDTAHHFAQTLERITL